MPGRSNERHDLFECWARRWTTLFITFGIVLAGLLTGAAAAAPAAAENVITPVTSQWAIVPEGSVGVRPIGSTTSIGAAQLCTAKARFWAYVRLLTDAGEQIRTGMPRRDIVDAILYVVRSGCAWRQLPADFPPWETVYSYFTRREKQKLTFRMVDALGSQVRVGEGRNADPSAGLMDSQSVRGADTVGADTRGYDAGKKINGRKRSIVTDTLGLLLVVLVMPASVQDRDGARKLLLELRPRQLMSRVARRVRHLFADGGFAGALIDWARTLLKTTIEVVRNHQGRKDSRWSPDGGRSNAPSPGSPATDASPATTNATGHR